jgi:hypothetical protein
MLSVMMLALATMTREYLYIREKEFRYLTTVPRQHVQMHIIMRL